MENLRKENVTLKEQYLKLQEDQNANSVSTTATHHTHQAKTDKADTMWREGTLSITQPI